MTTMVAREWDSAARQGASNPSPAALIQEFARRGAAVPFTTPSLSHSRVRAGEAGSLEVVVPALGGAKGVYIIPIKDLPLAVTMSVHDRVLHKLIVDRRASNPDLLRSVILEVERQGLAGPVAAANAVQALEREAIDQLICAVYLIRIAFAKVEGQGSVLTLEELTSKEGQARVRALLGTIARETGGTADAYYTAIEQWGEVIAAVGVPEMEQPCRLRLLVRALLDLSSQILRWTKNDDSTDAERAVALSHFAKDVGVAAKQIVGKIDAFTQDFTDTLMRWSEIKEEITVLVDQLSWMLDGWDRHIDRWRDAAQMSRPMQVTAIHAIADAFPERIKRTAPPAAAIKVAERNAKLARLSIGQDWRTGAVNGAKPRDAASKPKLTEPAAAQVDQLAEKQFDLSEDQLGKLVGVLAKARDSKEGDALGKDALDSIRPRLKVSQPYRPLTLERLFCVPFEDFLADGVAALRPGAILRGSIRPCWKFVEESLPKDLVKDLTVKVDAVATRDHQVLVDMGQLLWPTADAVLSTIIARIEAGGEERQRALERLGGERTLSDLLLIGEALQVAAPIMHLRGFLTPKPMLDLNAQRLAGVIQAFEELNRPLRMPLLLRTLIGRVGDSGELLQALGTASIDDPRARKLAGAVRAEMVADLKDRIAALTTPETAPPKASLPTAVANLAEEAAERFQVIGATPSGGEAGAGDGMTPLRARIVETVRETVLTPAESSVLLALSGAAGEAGHGFEAMGQAEAHAHALRQCAGFAEALGLAGEVTTTLGQLAKGVEQATERLLAPPPGASAMAVPGQGQQQALLVHAVRMLEILSNPNRADQLRLRVERAGAA